VHAGLFSPGQGRNSIPAVRVIFLPASRCMLKADSNGISGRNKLAVSKLRSRLLETRKIPGWKDYLRDMITILHGLVMLECEMRDIQVSLLVGIIFWSSLFLLAYLNVIRSSSKFPTNANSRKTYTKTRRLSRDSAHPQYSSTCLNKFLCLRPSSC
jgi:hypothetical protein